MLFGSNKLLNAIGGRTHLLDSLRCKLKIRDALTQSLDRELSGWIGINLINSNIFLHTIHRNIQKINGMPKDTNRSRTETSE